MKSGLALEMGLLADVSEPATFPRTFFSRGSDEENTSAGMRGAVPGL